ncbi:hypothetical protein BH20CHL7_BH20CHL7_10040 [soil metagenome]
MGPAGERLESEPSICQGEHNIHLFHGRHHGTIGWRVEPYLSDLNSGLPRFELSRRR